MKGVDLSFLEGEKIISINWAIKAWPESDILFTQDPEIWAKIMPTMDGWEGLLIISANVVPDRLKGMVIESKGTKWAKSLSDPLPYCYRSGTPAINLAEILGADPIYLLGYDAEGPGSYVSHMEGYDGPPTKAEVSGGDYAKHIHRLKYYSENDIAAKVINLSPDSKIECFDKMTIEEVLCPTP